MMVAGAWLCLLAPLAGALAITLAGTRISRRSAGWTSTLSVFVGFAGAVASFLATLGRDAADREELSTAWTWLAAGDFHVGLQILVDPVSLTMMLIVTGVGGLIVWYSMGYMAGEDEERRYFAYMALFVFSMLMLVQGGNLLLLLVGWGLVGLASYLLIGFYHERPEAVAAAKKAFVMNAIGDAAMALSLFLLIAKTGSLDFSTAFDAASSGELSSSTANLVALGLLGGAVAKSAQLPLHTWLPDAMEGPTPVSALIHAATMVTAGVYLIVRAHPLFEAAPDVQHLAAILGAVTLLVAGVIALVQNDIKRVIAYSTMSQIGYMFLGAGIGAYSAAMFHLMTHAFFKALLFLAAGVVIHHLAGEQDIRQMGGLKRFMPYTNVVFLIGSLALVGIPPLSGFWSKDAIIASALADGGALGWTLFVAALVGVLLTGLYTFRLYYLVFHGEPSQCVLDHAGGHGDHGTGPRARPVTASTATARARIDARPGRRARGAGHDRRPDQHPRPVAPVLELDRRGRRAADRALSTGQDYLTSLIAVTMGVVGILIARSAFGAGLERRQPARSSHRLLEHKLYFDELYDAVFSRRPRHSPCGCATTSRRPSCSARSTRSGAAPRRPAAAWPALQTGLLRTYALAIAARVVVLAIVFVAVR